MKINAYYDNTNVYTILTFPIVTYPNYEIVRTIPLPVYNNKNIFVIPKTTNTLLAINKENRNYLTLKENDLNKCAHSGTTFVCEINYPVYFITARAPCEVQIYIGAQKNSCEQRHILSSVAFWITLTEPQTWLFSTPNTQQINIQCNDQAENKIKINRTGKIKLNENCKLTTTDVTIQTKKRTDTKIVQMYLPEFNVTIEESIIIDNKIDSEKEIKLEPVIRDPAELIKLSLSLDEIKREVENNQPSVFANKNIVYPVGSATLIITILVIKIKSIYIIRKKRNH